MALAWPLFIGQRPARTVSAERIWVKLPENRPLVGPVMPDTAIAPLCNRAVCWKPSARWSVIAAC